MKKYVAGAALWLLTAGRATAQPAPAVMPLDRAIQLALQNNKGIKLADVRTRSAEARTQESKDRSLPQATASVAYSRYSLTGPFAFGQGSDGKPLFGIPAGASRSPRKCLAASPKSRLRNPPICSPKPAG